MENAIPNLEAWKLHILHAVHQDAAKNAVIEKLASNQVLLIMDRKKTENPKTLLKYMLKFVVVEENLTPLLSRKAAEKMELITVNYERFESVNGVMNSLVILRRYPDIFNGDVGNLPGSVRLTLKHDAEPILRPPKRLPVELKDSVKQELDRLVKAGVLAPVDEPTDWVNQMAIATKKDGSLRICIDPRHLNLSLK